MSPPQNPMPIDIGTIHFIGIGGIGMSGIAEVLCSLGYTIQGSDMKEGANTRRLHSKGAQIFIGHSADNLKDKNGNAPVCVVISSAIKDSNTELAAARAQKIPVIRRAEMLAELMRMKRSIAIAGTHGKTTTTSMVGQVLDTGNIDPTIINGGIVNRYGTNTRMGQSEWMVVEADESDGTFTRLPISVAVVTNMDPEHMEHYGTFDKVREAYTRFIHNLPFYGYAVLCMDHPEVQALIPTITDRRVITYGENPQAMVRMSDIRTSPEGSHFNVTIAPFKQGDQELTLRDVFLPMPGLHNVQNALVALAIGHEMGIAPPLLKKALAEFSGVKRRFTNVGDVDGIRIIDDYAHHPVEIETVLKGARASLEGTDGKVIVVKQPHRYTRLHDLFEEFCTCFNDADTVIIADVYTAGEEPIEGADKDGLVEGIKSHGHRDARALESREKLAETLADIANPSDMIIFMGAGDITAWAYDTPKELKAARSKKNGKAA